MNKFHLLFLVALFTASVWCQTTSSNRSVQTSIKVIGPPPAGKIYHAVYPGGVTGAEDDITYDSVLAYQKKVGKEPVWIYFSCNWFKDRKFPIATATWIRSHGYIPFIRLMLRKDTNQNHSDSIYSPRQILRGNFDNDLRQWARSAKDFGTPLMVEYGTEANGMWFPWNGWWNGKDTLNRYGDPTFPDGPERFRDAFRKIVSIMRSEGAYNISWVFHVDKTDLPSNPWNRFENYYPGDNYVDWLGISVYSAQSISDQEHRQFGEMMDSVYNRLTNLSANKPIAVLEFGVANGHPLINQAAWADSALSKLTSMRWPRISAISWWNEAWKDSLGRPVNMRVQDNPALSNVFHKLIGENSNVLGTAVLIDRTVPKQNVVFADKNFSFKDTSFNVDGDIITSNATVTFKNCTLNISGNLNITASKVNLAGSKVNIILQRDQQYSVQIYGKSNVTLDSTVMQGVNYQTEFYCMAENGNSPTVILRNKSRCLNHAGFGFYGKSAATVSNSNIGEVQARDQSQILIQNGSAYLVFFYPQGTFSISDIHAGKNISRIIELPNFWKVTIQNADSLINGYQLDLYKGTNLTLNNSTDIVLSVHTPGSLNKKVSISGITKSFLHSDSLTTLGPLFYFNNSRIDLFNIYTSGKDSVEVHNMSVNESSAYNNSVLIIGTPFDSTFAACNLMQTQNHGEIQLVNATVKPDSESEPSAFALDSSRIIFKNSNLQKLKIGATLASKIYIWNCKNYDATLTHLFDNAQLFFSLPTSVEDKYTSVPHECLLFQNYPNPFNPTTTIRFSVPERIKASLIVYDLLGREVARLFDGEIEPGLRSIAFDASNMSSGVYFYKLSTPKFSITKKLMLVK